LRKTIGARLAFHLDGQGFERLGPPLLDALARALNACRQPGFIAGAMQRRSARVVGMMQPLPVPEQVPEIDLDSVLVHRPTAFCHLTANPHSIDFSHPGGHIYIHRGAEAAVLFIVDTPRFRPRDLPGGIDSEVQLSLCKKLLDVGFLEVASHGR
jgi:bifunctional lysine-specific demethylase and histidyl-hydroxylase MINA